MLFVGCGLFAGSFCFAIGFDSLMAGPNTNTLPFYNQFIYALMMGGSYIGGSLFFMFKFPENLFPGKFNVFNSHVIWHCFVFLGQVMHIFVVLETYQNRVAMKCISVI